MSSSTRDISPARRAAAQRVMEPLIEALHALATCDEGQLRVLAIPPLGSLRHPQSLEVLARALGADETRMAARAALVETGSPGSLTLLKKLIDQAQDVPFRHDTLVMLGGHALPEATDLLLTYAESQEPAIRRAAAEALAQRPSSDRVEEKLLTLLEDPDRDVAVAALLALRRVGTARSTVPLLRILKDSKNDFVRSTAILTLGRLAPAEASAAVKRYLQDPDDRIRASAVEALGRGIQDHLEDAPLLLKAMEDPSNRVRGNAVVALWEVDPDRCRKPFFDLMKSPRPVFRSTAAWVVGQVQSPELFQAYLPVINTELDKDVLAMAMRAIEEAESPRLVDAMGKLLEHPNREVRLRGTRTFARLARLSERTRLLRALTRETDPEIKSEMLGALGRLSDSGNFSEIFPFLDERDPVVVAHALEALSRVGDLAVLPVIEDCLKHKEPRIQVRAMCAMLRMGKLEALGSLATMLGSAGRELAEVACEGAAEMGRDLDRAGRGEAGLPILESTLESLSRRGGAPAEDSLPPAAPVVEQSADWEVHVARALGAGDAGASLAELGRQHGPYLAGFAARRMDHSALTPEDEQHFRAHHFLPGLFLALERERAGGARGGEVQRRYLDLADAQLAIYRQFVERARERAREGQTAEVFQMLDFFFRQVKLAPDLHVAFGANYLGLKEYDLAYEHLLKACAASPTNPELLFQAAGAAIRVGKRAVARALLEGLVPQLPPASPLRERVEAMLDLC